jgi:hypothetical protein
LCQSIFNGWYKIPNTNLREEGFFWLTLPEVLVHHGMEGMVEQLALWQIEGKERDRKGPGKRYPQIPDPK